MYSTQSEIQKDEEKQKRDGGGLRKTMYNAKQNQISVRRYNPACTHAIRSLWLLHGHTNPQSSWNQNVAVHGTKQIHDEHFLNPLV